MLHPLVRNLTENVAAVQFDHRLLATLTLILVSATAIAGWRSDLPRPLAVCLGVAVLCQYGLGVTTLLLVVPVSIATLHQLGAVLLLTAVLVVVHRRSGIARLSRQSVETTHPVATTLASEAPDR
jgi:cytochrome c oxidase assembly protein subunit 15